MECFKEFLMAVGFAILVVMVFMGLWVYGLLHVLSQT